MGPGGVVGSWRVSVLLAPERLQAWEAGRSFRVCFACQEGSCWQQCLLLPRHLRGASLLLRSLTWHMSMALMDSLRLTAIEPNSITWGAYLTAQAAGAQWRQALGLRSQLSQLAFNSRLAAHRRARQWRSCLSLFVAMSYQRWPQDEVALQEVSMAMRQARVL